MTAANKMKTLLECGNVIKGFVYHQDEQREELWFDGTPENIASFIALRSCAHHMILTDRLDNFILSTIGNFIDTCPDQQLCHRIKEHLIPMQMGMKVPAAVFSPSVYEIEQYCSGCEE